MKDSIKTLLVCLIIALLYSMIGYSISKKVKSVDSIKEYDLTQSSSTTKKSHKISTPIKE